MFHQTTFGPVDLETANKCLVDWGHKMGPLLRGNERGHHFALVHDGEPVAVAMTSGLIAPNVHLRPDLNRSNTVELSRLCAARPGLCRVALRLWREFAFPALGVPFAISYQDADLHNGRTYRFDGWTRIGYARGRPDHRSGREGRNRWIWLWSCPSGAAAGLKPERIAC